MVGDGNGGSDQPSRNPLLSLFGNYVWATTRDCTNTNLGAQFCIGAINIGDYRCRTQSDDITEVYKQLNYRRLNAWLYMINCTIPDPSVNTAPHSHAVIPHRYPWRLLPLPGKPRIPTLSYHTDAQGDPYLFQMHPVIETISPAVGSTAGGTTLTITGKGFPNSALNLGDSLSVMLPGGASCNVVSSMYSKIICSIQKPSADYTTADYISGTYPGTREMLATLNDTVTVENSDGFRSILTGRWENTDEYTNEWYSARTKASFTTPITKNHTFYLSDDDKAFLTTSLEIIDEYTNVYYSVRTKAFYTAPITGDYIFYLSADDTAFLTPLWENIDEYTNEYYSARTKAFYTAPITGDYIFYLSADDKAFLSGTLIVNGSEKTLNLCEITRARPIDNYDASESISAPVSLQAGQSILLEAAMWNGIANGNHQTYSPAPVNLQAGQSILLEAAMWNGIANGNHLVGVKVPRTGLAPKFGSIRERVFIRMISPRTKRTNQYKFMWPKGGDKIVNITVTPNDLSNTYLVEETRIGIMLTVAPGKTTTIRLSTSADEVATQLHSVLGYSNSSTRLQLGVLKEVGKNKEFVTFQVAANAAVLTTLTKADITAKLVILNPLSPPLVSQSDYYTGNVCSHGNSPPPPPPPPPAYSSPPAYTSPPAYDSPPPPPPSTLLSLVSLAVTDCAPLAAVTPSGKWRIQAVQDPDTGMELAWDASKAEMTAALTRLTGLAVASVSIDTNQRHGPYLANVWDVEYVWSNDGNNAPPVMAVVGTGAPARSAVSSNLTGLAATPVTGSFSLGIGDDCETITIVLGEDNPRTITFDPLLGDVPSMYVADDSQLLGVQAVVVQTLTNGSSDFLYRPIPTELLQIAVASPDTVRVSVNSVPSSCGEVSDCVFSYDASSTPTLTSASPTTLTFADDSSLELVIAGTGFSTSPAENLVKVGLATCTPLAATATQINCSLPASASAGSHPLNVTVAGLGLAEGDVSLIVEALMVSSISATTMAASASGFVTITGRGFDTELWDNNAVTIDSVACTVAFVNAEGSELVALYPGNGGSAVPEAEVVVTIGAGLDSDTATDTISISPTAPYIASLAPAYLSSGGGTISVEVYGVDSSTLTAVWLLPDWAVARRRLQVQEDSTLLAHGQYEGGTGAVQSRRLQNAASAFGDSYSSLIPCHITGTASHTTEVDTHTLECVTGPLPNNDYFLAVEMTEGAGPQLLSGSTMAARLSVTSVSPAVGSIGGGTLVTVTGDGFNSVDPSGNIVLMEVIVSTTHLNGLVLCDVESATRTQLQCRTRAHLAADASSSDPGAKNVVMGTAGMSDVEKFEVWAAESSARAVIATSDASATTFSYTFDASPTLSTTSSIAGAANEAYSIGGYRMADVTVVKITAPAGNVVGECQDLEVTDDLIDCILSAIPAGVYLIQLETSGNVVGECQDLEVTDDLIDCVLPAIPAGVYLIQLETSEGERGIDPKRIGLIVFQPVITHASPSAGSIAGGSVITLTATTTGFNTTHVENNMVTIAGSPCEIASVTSKELTCVTPSVALTATTTGFNTTHVENNMVTIAGSPCEIASVTSKELTCVTPCVILTATTTGFNTTHVENTMVIVAGSPCEITSVGSEELSCNTPRMQGSVLAETLPDLISYSIPEISEFLPNMDYLYFWPNGPTEGIAPTFFAGRFTFFMEINTEGTYNFVIRNDDLAALYVDEVKYGESESFTKELSVAVVLKIGWRKFVITMVNLWGGGSIGITYDGGPAATGAKTKLPWANVSPVRPGQPVSLSVAVNGAPAMLACSETTVDLANGLPSSRYPLELHTVDLTNSSCWFVYSSFRTPTLSLAPKLTGYNYGNKVYHLVDGANLTFTGDLLQGSLDESSYTVTLAGMDLGGVSVVEDADGLVQALPPPPFHSPTTFRSRIPLSATASPSRPRFPPHPAKELEPPSPVPQLPTPAPLTRIPKPRTDAPPRPPPPSSIPFPPPPVTPVQVTGPWTSTWQGRGSVYGGLTVTVAGGGFAPLNLTLAQGRHVRASFSTDMPFGLPWLLDVPVKVLTASATKMTVFIPRFYMSKVKQFSNGIRLRMYTDDGEEVCCPTLSSYFNYRFDPTYTPRPTSVSALAAIQPSSASALTITWNIPSGTGLLAPAGGQASNVTVELWSGPINTLLDAATANMFTCSSPTVVSAAQGSTYREELSCVLPKYIPSSNYTLWINHQQHGAGYNASVIVKVPISLASVVPVYGVHGGSVSGSTAGAPVYRDYGGSVSGSTAGGIQVIITADSAGGGFDPTTASATLGGAPCEVLQATRTALTLMTPALTVAAAAAASGRRRRLGSLTTLPIMVTPSLGATPQYNDAIVFTYDSSLTPTASAISPVRGSSAGGTAITITGSGFIAAVAASSSGFAMPAVTIGSYTCGDVTVVDDTTITCVTSHPGIPKPLGPLPVLILFDGIGYADVTTVGMVYEYVDLWSRRTTWGGGDPPVEGDLVGIPAGTTVLLDVSPPRLGALILWGNLYFDPSVASLEMRADYILLMGGNLSVGTEAEPYPGQAKIVLCGKPNALELPNYGAKALAIREGNLVLHGQHKVPTFTQLAATAGVGATELSLAGKTNWAVGDAIAISSSSFFAQEVDEATITAISYDAGTDTTKITVNKPMVYTHLGVTMTIAGDDRQHQLDMRAEVAVLTRNVVVEGDEFTQQFQFGGVIMVSTPTYIKKRALMIIEQIEIRQMGQAFKLGRYALHWHMHGDVAFKSYLKGNAIHHTYNRGVTLHNVHRALVQGNVFFDNLGHAIFMEDGIETASFWIPNPNNTYINNHAGGSMEGYSFCTGNRVDGNLVFLTHVSDTQLHTDTTPASFWITNPNNTYINNHVGGSMGATVSGNRVDGNLVFLTRVSDTLLNTDTTPASFWITNPNNTYTNNHAGGSTGGYGFWYMLEDFPSGPSATTSVCPKYTPLGEFSNNRAHSNMFYGLRIHPQYFPKEVPCRGWSYAQSPAVFQNGVKGVVGTELGLIQFRNFTVADNGAGPLMHVVNGKDNGGGVELSWIEDDRNRYDVGYDEMAGIASSIIIARTAEGRIGTAGRWPSAGRKIAAITTQSPIQGHPRHSALLSIMDVTFVGFSETPYTCLEACGKCKNFQGGAPAFTGGLKFIQDGYPILSLWTWNHQGIFYDTDGTLLNSDTLPSDLLPTNFQLGAGASWHSAIDNELFNPAECTYVDKQHTSNRGAFCSPRLSPFRRIMLNSHTPHNQEGAVNNLEYRDLLVTDVQTNRTSTVHFIVYNEDGYQFTVPTGREYEVHWKSPYRMDAVTYTIHKPDLLRADDWVRVQSKFIQKMDNIQIYDSFSATATGTAADLTTPLTAASAHRRAYYNQTFGPSGLWFWNNTANPLLANRTYNDTTLHIMIGGVQDAPLHMRANRCPLDGCSNGPTVVVDERDGLLRWSELVTWADTLGRIPIEGDNVIIPQGWNLIIDVSPPPLNNVSIQGNVTFDTSKAITFTATYIVVSLGDNETHPYNGTVTIILDGTCQTTIIITCVYAGNETNPYTGDVTIFLNGTRQTTDYTISEDLNMGAKVMLSTLIIARSNVGEQFGCRVLVHGASVLRFSGVAMQYCGQSGLSRPALEFRDLQSINSTLLGVASNESTLVYNPSKLVSSALLHNIDSAVIVRGGNTSQGILIENNVFYESFDTSMVSIVTGNNIIRNNLGVGVIKNMEGVSSQDMNQIGVFEVAHDNDTLTGNVAAGRERGPCSVAQPLWRNNSAHSCLNDLCGRVDPAPWHSLSGATTPRIAASMVFVDPAPWHSLSGATTPRIAASMVFVGGPCSVAQPLWRNNSAHSCLNGLWMQASKASDKESCTKISNFTSWTLIVAQPLWRNNSAHSCLNGLCGRVDPAPWHSLSGATTPRTAASMVFGCKPPRLLTRRAAPRFPTLPRTSTGGLCSVAQPLWRNNSAHSCLNGLWMQASKASDKEGCTKISNFTSYLHWDFGILTTTHTHHNTPYTGGLCSVAQPLWRNNSAHSCLNGLWMQASKASDKESCTKISNFTSYLHWDFGILTTTHTHHNTPYTGGPCSVAQPLWRNNSAHSCLNGLWMQASKASDKEGCTKISNFTSYLHWDFGILTMRGLKGNANVVDVNLLDSKHVGLLMLMVGGPIDAKEVLVQGGVFAGQTGPEVCAMCIKKSDPGCAPKVSSKSYNQETPFGASVAFGGAAFAQSFASGPEKKPWDSAMSYPTMGSIFRSSFAPGPEKKPWDSAMSYPTMGSIFRASFAPGPEKMPWNSAMSYPTMGSIFRASFAPRPEKKPWDSAMSYPTSFAPGPEKKPWDSAMSYPTVGGILRSVGSTFADSMGPSGCGQGSFAIGPHQRAPDAGHPHWFSKANVVNVENSGMFRMLDPDPRWRNEADCGFQTLTLDNGTKLELNCNGLKHTHYKDLDGSLTGGIGSVNGMFGTQRLFPYDQGTPVIPGACTNSHIWNNYTCLDKSCTYSPTWNSYTCLDNVNSFLLNPAKKPNPIPQGGIFGDPQLFVLESRDADMETRNFGPVFFNLSGSVDVNVACMDHGWCFAYTCLKRLSTFWTYLPTYHEAEITFQGTPAKVFRLWYPYAPKDAEMDAEVVVSLNY
eukprot:gene8886-3764_t